MKPQQLTKYGPKLRTSPAIGELCPLCGIAFAAGDYTTLLRKTHGGKYADDGTEVHWDCVARRWPIGTGTQETAARDHDAVTRESSPYGSRKRRS